MAAVVHCFKPHTRVADERPDSGECGGKDGVEQRAAFDGAGSDEGEREQHAALLQHRLLPRHTGIARGEDGVKRDRFAFGRGQGGGNGAVVQGVGHGGIREG